MVGDDIVVAGVEEDMATNAANAATHELAAEHVAVILSHKLDTYI